jgi:hypothetical protein
MFFTALYHIFSTIIIMSYLFRPTEDGYFASNQQEHYPQVDLFPDQRFSNLDPPPPYSPSSSYETTQEGI